MARGRLFSRRSAGDDVGAADWSLAAVVVLLSLVSVRTGAPTSGTTSSWAQALVLPLALGQGVPLALRKRRPGPVAVCVLACYAGQGLLEGVVPPFAAWVVIWSLGSSRDPRAAAVRVIASVAAVTCALIGMAELTRPGVGASALLVLVTALVALAAVLRRTDRARVDALREQAATEERLRIARDLHDLVGHGLSVVAVQSSSARMALDAGDDETARTAMGAVEASSRTALGELRQMLGVLSEGPSGVPAPGIDDIPALVANLRAGGMPVEAELVGELGSVPRATQLCAYRVVQEALTNVVKHAAGARVAVRVAAGPGMLSVAVESTGGRRSTAALEGGGRGLDGLRARVASVSGEVRAEPVDDGWLLQARLPLPRPDQSATVEEER